MSEIGQQLVADGLVEKLNDRFVMEEDEWNARIQPWYGEEVDRRLHALYGQAGLDLVANHFARLPNPLKVIVEKADQHDQAKFDHIVNFILDRNTNTRFWI